MVFWKSEARFEEWCSFCIHFFFFLAYRLLIDEALQVEAHDQEQTQMVQWALAKLNKEYEDKQKEEEQERIREERRKKREAESEAK